MGDVVAQHEKEAYAAEAGRRQAIADQLENIRAEVRTVTKEAETIKAEITGGLWVQQWQLNQKRAAYAGLLTSVDALVATHSKLANALAGYGGWTPGNADKLYEERERQLDALTQRCALAEIFLCSAAVEALHCWWHDDSGDVLKDPTERNAARMRAIDKLREGLVSAARSELRSDAGAKAAAR